MFGGRGRYFLCCSCFDQDIAVDVIDCHHTGFLVIDLVGNGDAAHSDDNLAHLIAAVRCQGGGIAAAQGDRRICAAAGHMTQVITHAVGRTLPDGVEVDRFTVLVDQLVSSGLVSFGNGSGGGFGPADKLVAGCRVCKFIGC